MTLRDFNQKILQLPEKQREKAFEIEGIVKAIDAYWTWYTLIISLAILFLFYVFLFILKAIDKKEVITFGLPPGLMAFLWIVGLYLIVRPISKLMFLQKCNLLLEQLNNVIYTEHGSQAYKKMAEWNSKIPSIINRVSKRRIHHWFF